MDKCVRITVALVVCSHLASGWSHIPRDETYQHFDHYFEGHHHDEWPNRNNDWDYYRPSPSHQRPAHYHKQPKDFNPHKQHNDKEWKTDHSGHWNSGSWEHHDFPNHGSNSWGHQNWGHQDTNHWPHHRPSSPSQPNKPSWNNAKPSTWGPIAPPSAPTTSTSRSSAGSGSQATLAILLCTRSCPVTSEYNPVCGSNNVTYGNPGRLECAKYCGVDVTLKTNSICTATAPNNTAAQNQTNSRPVTPAFPQTLKPIEPTRFTTVDVPATEPTVPTQRPPTASNPPFTISPDILNSIFTSTSSTTEDDNWEIDIRTRSRQPMQYVYPV